MESFGRSCRQVGISFHFGVEGLTRLSVYDYALLLPFVSCLDVHHFFVLMSLVSFGRESQ